jgi:hypothetical protein
MTSGTTLVCPDKRTPSEITQRVSDN